MERKSRQHSDSGRTEGSRKLNRNIKTELSSDEITPAKKARLLKEKTEKWGCHSVNETSPESECKQQHDDDIDRYDRSFFDQPCEILARSLLGKKLIRLMSDGSRLAGIIVETEAYLGEEDKAAHSYRGRKTPKNEAMFMQPGTVYVYNIYGMYTCMNFSAQGKGTAVLLRAVDPVEGEDVMRNHRGTKRSDSGQGLKTKELCSGPSKLTMAFHIDKDSFNKADITNNPSIWLQDPGTHIKPDDIVVTSRIGVNYAEEWTKKPLRFYIRGNQSVSIRDKVAEAGQN